MEEADKRRWINRIDIFKRPENAAHVHRMRHVAAVRLGVGMGSKWARCVSSQYKVEIPLAPFRMRGAFITHYDDLAESSLLHK